MESGISEQPITALPPSSIDAERSVLGAMMQDSGAATLAFETLMPVDFYSAEHREIFEAMRALHLSGSPIDLMTVGNELTKRGTLESVGGAPYLLQAVRFVPTTANTRTYIEIVMEKSTLRKLIAASQQIQQQCYAQADPLQDVLHNAERLIFDIVMKRAGAETLVPLNRVLMSTFDQIEELSRLKGRLAGVPTGLYDLDRMLTGLHGGELVLVGARPAMGKTSMALGVTQFAARQAKRCVAVFSMEMPSEQIGLRLLCSAASINMQRVRSGMLSDDEWVKIGDAINELSTCRVFIDDTPGLTPSQLRSRCRRLMLEQGLDLIVIDYLGLMGTDKRVENRQLEVSEISRQLKAIALELKIPVLACAQLSRAPAARTDKRPMLSDLRDSGSIEQDADVVLFLHREGYYASAAAEDGPKPDDNAGEVIIAKQRNGPVGTVNVEWQAEFARYTNLPGTRVAMYMETQA
ncbi:MAG: replicative DNA helicase [Clostridiales bacterium]|nr:replicative DNA helicase [Clostridiales bacterium]MDY4007349.1 replicative DNA helicase [Candidatus Limiplasma sp.]